MYERGPASITDRFTYLEIGRKEQIDERLDSA